MGTSWSGGFAMLRVVLRVSEVREPFLRVLEDGDFCRILMGFEV